MTGDEPRYAAGGLGIYAHVALDPSAATWDAFVAKSGLPARAYPYTAISRTRAPALGPSIVFGLPLRVFGLGAARWLNFVIGAGGLLVVFALLRRRFSSGKSASLATVTFVLAAVAFAIPYVEYARLLYPEILLFTTTSIAFYALVTQKRMALVIAAGLLPLEHVRGLPLSLAFALLALSDALRGYGSQRSIVRPGLTYIALLGAWALLDIRVYGSVTGAAFSTHQPAFATFLPRLGTQLFDVRHGLLVYAPIYLLAFAGLVAGSIGRDSACVRAGLLVFVYVLTFVWSSAAESWSARFWVPALPMLAIGLAYWLTFARSLIARGVLALLAAMTLINTIVYCLHPMWFVQNRTSSQSYDALGAFTHIPLGSIFVPLDAADTNSTRATAWLIAAIVAVLALIALEAATARGPARARARAPHRAMNRSRRKR